jgi:hypothetical protein
VRESRSLGSVRGVPGNRYSLPRHILIFARAVDEPQLSSWLGPDSILRDAGAFRLPDSERFDEGRLMNDQARRHALAARGEALTKVLVHAVNQLPTLPSARDPSA